MRRRAQRACREAKIIDKPALIGFSNAANVLRKNAARDCKTISDHSSVVAIGDSRSGAHLNNKAKACGKFKIVHPHEVPSLSVLIDAIPYSPPEVMQTDRARNPSRRSVQ